MIDVLIFSKDRAAQLDLLLQSIARYAPRLYRSATLLVHESSGAFQRGYCQAERAHFQYRWEWEASVGFQPAIDRWLSQAGDTISFLVDDDVFYREAPPEWFNFYLPASLRPGDYDYPWALDACIYDKATILERLPEHFDNPTQLEAGMAEWTAGQSLFRTIWPCVVGIHANRVSESSNMPFTGGVENDPATMNEWFLEGKRIDLDATLAGVEIVGTHQSIPYVWR